MTIIAIKNNGIPESANTNLGIKCSYLKQLFPTQTDYIVSFFILLSCLGGCLSLWSILFIFAFIILLLLNDKPQAVQLFRAPSQLHLTDSSVFRFMFASETPIVISIVTLHSVFHLH